MARITVSLGSSASGTVRIALDADVVLVHQGRDIAVRALGVALVGELVLNAAVLVASEAEVGTALTGFAGPGTELATASVVITEKAK